MSTTNVTPTLDFPRQREPVEVLLLGDDRDVAHYARLIRVAIEQRGYDNVEIIYPDRLKIYPAANND